MNNLYQKPHIAYGWKSIDFLYGQKVLRTPTLNHELNTVPDYHFFSSLQYFGVSMTHGLRWNGRFNGLNHFSYTQVLPQKIAYNDSISAWLTGGNFYLTVIGFDLFYYKPKIDFMIGFGFNTGRLRLLGDPLIKQKNPYFTPTLTIAPRYFIGDISLQIRASIDYDISSENWRRMTFSKSDKVNIGPTSMTGINVFFAIGYKMP
ncbi:MAG: hypothetical protein P8I55_07310 [Crocinitomix sp.]|nr:hypothetical protein [Crocinitomix sp.]